MTKGSPDITLTQCRLFSPQQIKEQQVALANYYASMSALSHTLIKIHCKKRTILFTSK